MPRTTRIKRNLVRIDEDRCNGCGACVIKCAEGALQIIDGKARLVSEKYCDGLGACLGECPQGAISVIEQIADEFNEEAVKEHLETEIKPELKIPFTCPSSAIKQFASDIEEPVVTTVPTQQSALTHWPVQLMLIPPSAPFLQNADLILAADCAPFAYANFHQDFIKNHAVLVSCPKQNDYRVDQEKLTEIIEKAHIKSLTVVHMEVPCCSALVYIAQEAIKDSKRDIPFKDITIGIKGNRLDK